MIRDDGRDDGRLLALEVDVIHGLDPDPYEYQGDRHPQTLAKGATALAVWAWSPRARLLALASGIAHPGGVDDGDHQKYTPGEPPAALLRLTASLGDRPVSVEGGPSYVFPPQLAPPRPVPLPVIVSTAEGRAAARRLVRPDNWQPGEWSELIEGRIGEWAMAVHDESPVSICHTPASNGTAAEAGVWTRPDFRGRRLAPAVVTAWSRRRRQLRQKDVLFYSTTAANHASQSVARGLGLVPLGWIWTACEA